MIQDNPLKKERGALLMDSFEIWDNWELLLSRMQGKGMDSEFDKLIEIQNQAFGELEKIEKVTTQNGEMACRIGMKFLKELSLCKLVGEQLFGKIEIGDSSVSPNCIFINIIGRIENGEGSLYTKLGRKIPFIFRFDEDSKDTVIMEPLVEEIPLFYDWIVPMVQKVYSPLNMAKNEHENKNADLEYYNALSGRLESDPEKLMNLQRIRLGAWSEMHNSKLMLKFMADTDFTDKYVQMSDQEKLDEKFKIAKSIGCRYVTEIRELNQNSDGSINGPLFYVINAASFPFCTALYIQGCLEKSLHSPLVPNNSEAVMDCVIKISNENNDDVSPFKENMIKLEKMYPEFRLNIDSDDHSKSTEKTEVCEANNSIVSDTIKDGPKTPKAMTDSLDQMLLSQLIAFYLDTSDSKYYDESLRRLNICGFTKEESKKLIDY